MGRITLRNLDFKITTQKDAPYVTYVASSYPNNPMILFEMSYGVIDCERARKAVTMI